MWQGRELSSLGHEGGVDCLRMELLWLRLSLTACLRLLRAQSSSSTDVAYLAWHYLPQLPVISTSRLWILFLDSPLKIPSLMIMSLTKQKAYKQ